MRWKFWGYVRSWRLDLCTVKSHFAPETFSAASPIPERFNQQDGARRRKKKAESFLNWSLDQFLNIEWKFFIVSAQLSCVVFLSMCYSIPSPFISKLLLLLLSIRVLLLWSFHRWVTAGFLFGLCLPSMCPLPVALLPWALSFIFLLLNWRWISRPSPSSRLCGVCRCVFIVSRSCCYYWVYVVDLLLVWCLFYLSHCCSIAEKLLLAIFRCCSGLVTVYSAPLIHRSTSKQSKRKSLQLGSSKNNNSSRSSNSNNSHSSNRQTNRHTDRQTDRPIKRRDDSIK